MASQHNATHIDKGPEEPHSIKYKQGSHDPSFRAYKQQKHYMSEYRQLQKKKAEKPDYLQVPLRYKIVAEVTSYSSKSKRYY